MSGPDAHAMEPPRLVAFQPDQPGNLGAMIRLSTCLGAPIEVIEPCGFAFSEKPYQRAMLDYGEAAKIVRWASWDSFLDARAAGGWRLALLTTKGETALWDHRFAPGERLMVGRESAGVPAAVAAAADARLRIPMKGAARALNVGMAAAMALAEASRQLDRRDLA